MRWHYTGTGRNENSLTNRSGRRKTALGSQITDSAI
jgi:hypothetical protein